MYSFDNIILRGLISMEKDYEEFKKDLLNKLEYLIKKDKENDLTAIQFCNFISVLQEDSYINICFFYIKVFYCKNMSFKDKNINEKNIMETINQAKEGLELNPYIASLLEQREIKKINKTLLETELD
jgi:hypothetical protein